MTGSAPRQRSYSLGHLPVVIEGDSPFADALAAEFAPVAVESRARGATLTIAVAASLPPLEGAVAMSPVSVGNTAFAHTAGKLRYQVARVPDGLRLSVRVPPMNVLRALMPQAMQRATHFNFLDYWERRVKSFVYDAFDYAAQGEGLSLRQSFVHASAIESDGAAVALLAWGGIGKTTSLLKLVLEDGWRFLSDDLGLLDADGVLHRSPKHLQIYGYNLKGQPHIRRALFEGRSALDRASWAAFRLWKGDGRIRRRVSAESLFGERGVAKRGSLAQALFLERHDGRDFERRPLTAEALADRCASVLVKEISPFDLVACAVHGAGNRTTIPSVGEMYERSRSILLAAFSRVPCELVRIPAGALPDALVAYLRPLLRP